MKVLSNLGIELFARSVLYTMVSEPIFATTSVGSFANASKCHKWAHIKLPGDALLTNPGTHAAGTSLGIGGQVQHATNQCSIYCFTELIELDQLKLVAQFPMSDSADQLISDICVF